MNLRRCAWPLLGQGVSHASVVARSMKLESAEIARDLDGGGILPFREAMKLGQGRALQASLCPPSADHFRVALVPVSFL